MKGKEEGRPSPGFRDRREAGRRRAGLSTERITAEAVRLADAEGLEAVSIRRLAAELDARPMSFYDHFESKDELLGAMREEAIGTPLGPLPEGWREALATIARRAYAAMIDHPWIVAIPGHARRFGHGAAEAAGRSAVALADLGLEPADLSAAQGAIDDYVLGHSLRTVSIARGPASGDAAPADPVPTGRLDEAPELAALPSFRNRDPIERFEAGLQIVLDGIALRINGGEQSQR